MPTSIDYQLWIDGRWTAGNGARFERVNPADGSVASRIARADKTQAIQAITTARRAFDEGWCESDGAERAAILLALAEALMKHQERLARLETATLGAPLRFSREFIQGAAATFQYYAGLARGISGRSLRLGPNKTGFTLLEPLGVATLILPWNFPIGELAWKLGPALAAGCTVVAKPDLLTTPTTLEVGPMLQEAGLPDGVFNVVVGDVEEIGDVLTGHREVDTVSFTGSSASGRSVMRSASATVKPLHLELGGKSPLIVLADSDLDRAVADAANGVFWHNGQVCTASSRLLVEHSIMDEFLELLKGEGARMKLGDPLSADTDLGPVISGEHRRRIEGYIERAIEAGAQLVMDGRLAGETGEFVGPTIFADVTPDMELFRDEVFGPVAAVTSVDSLDEALALANDTEYGLGAGIWTDSLDAAMQAVHGLRTGMGWVNGYGAERCELPWGGRNQSGYGRELSPQSLEVYLNTKAVHMSW